MAVVPPVSKQPVEPAPQQYLRSITVYLPRSVHQRLRTQATSRGTTATALMLEAMNNTHEQLGAALAKTQQDKAGGDLFDIPQARGANEPNVQTTIRVTDHQHRTLAQLAATHATNRSRLITTALSLHLS